MSLNLSTSGFWCGTCAHAYLRVVVRRSVRPANGTMAMAAFKKKNTGSLFIDTISRHRRRTLLFSFFSFGSQKSCSLVVCVLSLHIIQPSSKGTPSWLWCKEEEGDTRCRCQRPSWTAVWKQQQQQHSNGGGEAAVHIIVILLFGMLLLLLVIHCHCPPCHSFFHSSSWSCARVLEM